MYVHLCTYTLLIVFQHHCTQKVDTEDVKKSGLLSPSAVVMSTRFATPVSTASVFIPAWFPNTMSVCKLHAHHNSTQLVSSCEQEEPLYLFTASNFLHFTHVSPTKSARLGSKWVLHRNKSKEHAISTLNGK